MTSDHHTHYAALDFGSNSTLMLIARADEHGNLREESELFRTTRLGSQLDLTGQLNPEGMNRALQAAREFIEQSSEQYKPALGIAAATSAVRDAANREDFLTSCRELLGRKPIFLTGEEEAWTIFLGAVSDQPPGQPCLVIDIGGGSSEVGIGFPGQCEAALSMDAGCVRLTEKFDLGGIVTQDRLKAARCEVRRIGRDLQSTITRHSKCGPATGLNVLVTGGTATTLAAYQLQMGKYDRSRIHGYRSTEERVSQIIRELTEMSAAQRVAIPGIPPGRAAVWPAGLIILSEILRGFREDSFRVSTRGLRYGLVTRLRQGELKPTWESADRNG